MDDWDDDWDDDDFIMSTGEWSKGSWWNLAGAGLRYAESLVGDTAVFLHRLADMTTSKHVENSDKKRFMDEAAHDIETITNPSEKDSL